MIKQRTIYTYENQDFDSLAKLKEHIENKIGSNIIDIMDISSTPLTPKQKLKILEVLSHPTTRKQLNKLLKVEYEEEFFDGGGMNSETKNILDL